MEWVLGNTLCHWLPSIAHSQNKWTHFDMTPACWTHAGTGSHHFSKCPQTLIYSRCGFSTKDGRHQSLISSHFWGCGHHWHFPLLELWSSGVVIYKCRAHRRVLVGFLENLQMAAELNGIEYGAVASLTVHIQAPVLYPTFFSVAWITQFLVSGSFFFNI